MAAKKAPSNFAELAQSLKDSADASLGYISHGDTISVIPTGSIVLDKLSGKGGIPVGRITQIASEPGIGKSTSALAIAASCQRLGGCVLYLDFEQSLTAEYIEMMGCVLDNQTMIFAQPTDIDAAWEIIDMASNLNVNLIILDSLAAMFPRVEDEDFKNLKASVGFQAKGLSLFIPRLKSLARVKNFAVLMINQVRAKISMGWGSQFVKSPAYEKELPGGFIPKFYTDLLYYYSLRKTEKESGRNIMGEKTDVHTGQEIKVQTWKNKIGTPFKHASMYLQFGRGIDDFRSVVEMGISHGIIDLKRGGFWTLPSQGDYPGVEAGSPILSGRGEDTISEMLAVNPQAFEYVRNKVVAVDFMQDLTSEESAGIVKLMTEDDPSGGAAPAPQAPRFLSVPTGFSSVPAPAMSAPPIPVSALPEDLGDDTDAPLVKRGRPKSKKD